jgi:arylsulfatase A-like enzyme
LLATNVKAAKRADGERARFASERVVLAVGNESLQALFEKAALGNLSRKTVDRQRPGPVPLTSTAAIALALAFGLAGGYLDLLIIVLRKYCWNPEGFFRTARDFPWTVPAGHALLLLVAGLVVAVMNRRPQSISLRMGTWIFATLAIWGALLRAPLYAAGTLLLAVGLGRVIGNAVATSGLNVRKLRFALGGLLGVLGVLAALSSGWQAVSERFAVARLPRPAAGARNVVLIVWDTVTAYHVGAYGFARDTTPKLEQWAKRGVRYNRALAPAPWTYPSHASFFTGQWPYQLNSQWNPVLDTPAPTLAEYLASQGFQTAGFAANTNCCSYETGLNRGFAHYEDYSLTPWSLLSRTVLGKWLLDRALNVGPLLGLNFDIFYTKKWINLQSRGARDINDRFLGWLGHRQPDRPFFAYLNYFDAHEPFVPPMGLAYGFGVRPRTFADYQFLFDYVGLIKNFVPKRDLAMARDCYDDCIAFLDEQLNQLLDTLKHQGLLENTVIIITSDHGEAFGDHGVTGHSYTVHLDEVGVPLVILAPSVPAGRVVNNPVSLRDLPSTVVDLVGLSAAAPFPGRSLTADWKSPSGRTAAPNTSPAFSERADRTALQEHPTRFLSAGWFQMSLAASNKHYIRDALGIEQLYDLDLDPYEYDDLMTRPDGEQRVAASRKKLLDVLDDNHASAEVENSYLRSFRQQLKSLVDGAERGIAQPSKRARVARN